MKRNKEPKQLETFSTVKDTDNKSLAICILANLSDQKSNEILVEMMDYYSVYSLPQLTEEQVLEYLHTKFNIM